MHNTYGFWNLYMSNILSIEFKTINILYYIQKLYNRNFSFSLHLTTELQDL